MKSAVFPRFTPFRRLKIPGTLLRRMVKGHFYKQHKDKGPYATHSISVSICLSDDYEGGELCFFDRELSFKLKKGQALSFPSNYLYPHEVREVTAGTRYALITWLSIAMKIVFYTCNTGYNEGFVPNILAELPESIDAYYLHDGGIPLHKGRGWNYIDIRDFSGCPENSLVLRQRFAKTLPHKFFLDADWTIYMDQKYYLPRKFFNEMLSLIRNEDGKTFLSPHIPKTELFN